MVSYNLRACNSHAFDAAATYNSYYKPVLTGGSSALLHSFDENFGEHWYKLDLGAGTLGSELLNVPDAVSYDGTDLLGVKITGKVGSVVRYHLADGTSTDITATSWSGQYSSASGTTLVK